MLVSAVSLAAFLAGACGPGERKDEAGTAAQSPAPGMSPAADERETSMVRVVNAIPGGQPADVWAGDAKTFSAVDYKTVTPYKEVRENLVTFKVQQGTEGTPLAQNTETLADGKHYTLFALPDEKGTGANLKVLADEMTPVEGSKARVRVVNASPGTKDVQVVIPGRKDPLVTGIGVAENSEYKEIDPVAGRLVVQGDEKKDVVAEVANASFEPGKSYTLLVLGRAVGTGKAEAMLIPDETRVSAPGAGASPGASPMSSPGTDVTSPPPDRTSPAPTASPTPRS
jgi:hypothetical protein